MMSSKHFLTENNQLLEKAKSKAKLSQGQDKKFSGILDNNIVTRNGQSGNTGLLKINFYVMLKFTERPKTGGMTSKKKFLSLKEMSSFAADFVLIWMKQRLIWFNLQRNGTRNGLSNIKKTFEENLHLQMSVLH